MFPAARVGDITSHPGVLSPPGVVNVRIGGQPAIVEGDMHSCAFPGLPFHPPSPMVTGSATVRISGRRAVRFLDSSACGALVIGGAPTVRVGG